jgi:hypothetical protein
VRGDLTQFAIAGDGMPFIPKSESRKKKDQVAPVWSPPAARQAILILDNARVRWQVCCEVASGRHPSGRS